MVESRRDDSQEVDLREVNDRMAALEQHYGSPDFVGKYAGMYVLVHGDPERSKGLLVSGFKTYEKADEHRKTLLDAVNVPIVYIQREGEFFIL